MTTWYTAGTAQVTSGSATVLGTGTQWISNAKIGQIFYGPDGLLYEILNVPSDTTLTLTKPYAGTSTPTGTYAVVPTQGYLRILSAQVADLIALYQQVPDNLDQAEAAAARAQSYAAEAINAQDAAEAARDAALRTLPTFSESAPVDPVNNEEWTDANTGRKFQRLNPQGVWVEFGAVATIGSAPMKALSLSDGASNVGTKQSGPGAILRTASDKFREFPTDADYDTLQRAVDANYWRPLVLTGIRQLPVDGLEISNPIKLKGTIGTEGLPGIILKKANNEIGVRVLSHQVEINDIWFEGSRYENNGFKDTTDMIRWGQNDGNSGTGTGFIDAQQGLLNNVVITKSGGDGLSWQEGFGLKIRNVHILESARHNFHVSETAFDASHGEWYAFSAGAAQNGFNINWGAHVFALLKSFSDAGRGVYLNKSYGSAGNAFVELSGGTSVYLDGQCGACNINLQFFTSGKDPWDVSERNNITGSASGNNIGPWVQHFARAKKMLIGDVLFTPDGPRVLKVGDPLYPTIIQAAGGGLSIRRTAVGRRVFNATGFPTINLDDGNSYIDSWVMAPGSTLNVNGPAPDHPYTPYDGQVVYVTLAGNGTMTIHGYIGGSYSNYVLTGVNKTVCLQWFAGIGFFITSVGP